MLFTTNTTKTMADPLLIQQNDTFDYEFFLLLCRASLSLVYFHLVIKSAHPSTKKDDDTYIEQWYSKEIESLHTPRNITVCHAAKIDNVFMFFRSGS